MAVPGRVAANAKHIIRVVEHHKPLLVWSATSYLAGLRQVLEDGDFARVGPDHAVVFVCRGQPEGDQAAHNAKRRLLQDGHLQRPRSVTKGINHNVEAMAPQQQ